jgi:hypothetical protein
LQYTAPDWVAIERFDPSGGSGGSALWYMLNGALTPSPAVNVVSNTVFAATTTFWNPNELNATNPSVSIGGTLASPGAGIYRAANGALAIAATATNVATFNTDSVRIGDAMPLLWSAGSPDTVAVRFGFYHGSGSPEGVQTANMGSFYTDWANGAFYGKTNGAGNTGWGVLNASAAGTGTTINPTDGFMPYRLNSTTFSNSPLEVFSANMINAAGMQGWFSFPANYSVGLGYLNGAAAGAHNVAEGYFAMQNATTASYNVAIGKEAGKSITDEQNNVYIGSVAGGNLVGGKNVVIGGDAGNVNWRYADNSVVIGYGNWGATGVLTNVVNSVNIGGRSGASPPTNTLNGFTNSIVIGNNAITHGNDTATIGDTNVTALYLGNTLISGGGGAPVGTMVESGITTAGVVPMTTGTTGTNYVASPMQGTGTNVAFNGGITANKITVTNTIDATGAITSGNQLISTIGAGNAGFKIQNGTGSSIAWNGVGIIKFTADGKMLVSNDGGNGLTWLQLGPDAATPSSVVQLKAPSGSGTDKNGGDLSLNGGIGTGTGRAGAVLVKTSNTSSTGSAAQTESTRAYYSAKFVDLTESSATLLFTVPVANTNYVGLTAAVTIYATDGTETQSQTTIITVDAVAKSTTITAAISPTGAQTGGALSTGTLSTTYTVADAGSNVLNVLANSVSSLSQTTFRAKFVITAINAFGTAVITPQ